MLCRFLLACGLVACLNACSGKNSALVETSSATSLIESRFTISELDISSPQSMSVFQIRPSMQQSTQLQRGHIRLSATLEYSKSKVYSKREHFTYAQDTKPHSFGEGRLFLPEISFDFVISNKNKLVPLARSLTITNHPTWDYFVGVGDVITRESGSHLVSMPFALAEKNQNCIHNGALLIELDDVGDATEYYYQISSETCAYFKADLWGKGIAELDEIKGRWSKTWVAEAMSYTQQEMVRPLSALSLKLNLDRLLLKHLVPEQEMTALGVIHQGILYQSSCQTRMGDYPFCNQLILPSYSMAKSVFGGMVSMALEHEFGDVLDQVISDWVPQCNVATNRERWKNVTFHHLLNMTTGNYLSTVHGVDEGAAHSRKFFRTASHEDKVKYACNQFPKRQHSGEQFVYHTSDTYLLGTGLQAYWRSKSNSSDADVFKDVLIERVFEAAGLSKVATSSRRTQNEDYLNENAGQPFAGFGLYFLPSDISKLTWYFAGHLYSDHSDVFAAEQLQEISTVDSATGIASELDNIRYVNSFWTFNLRDSLGCNQDKYVPYMSGFGGVGLVFLSPEIQFFFVSDTHNYSWRDAAKELNKINGLCEFQ